MAGIVCPWQGDRLSHGTYVVFDRMFADFGAASGALSFCADSMRKCLKKRDGIGDVLEYGVKSDVCAEEFLLSPICAH